MLEPTLDFHLLTQNALRQVIRAALLHVTAHGLPGEHHFFIGFHTGDEGVEMPAQLRQRHPGEMTIVLQNQFWNLEVTDSAFAVTLRFDGVAARVNVPLSAVTRFVDPAASFGLRFGASETNDEGAEPLPPAAVLPGAGGEGGQLLPFPGSRGK